MSSTTCPRVLPLSCGACNSVHMSTASNPTTEWVPDTSEALGARLALVRWRKGWNAKEAAIACGLPPQSWRDWEAGARPRDMVDICRKIAERTDVNFYWLLTGETPTAASGGPGGKGSRRLPHLDSNQEPAGYWPSQYETALSVVDDRTFQDFHSFGSTADAA